MWSCISIPACAVAPITLLIAPCHIVVLFLLHSRTKAKLRSSNKSMKPQLRNMSNLVFFSICCCYLYVLVSVCCCDGIAFLTVQIALFALCTCLYIFLFLLLCSCCVSSHCFGLQLLLLWLLFFLHHRYGCLSLLFMLLFLLLQAVFCTHMC